MMLLEKIATGEGDCYLTVMFWFIYLVCLFICLFKISYNKFKPQIKTSWSKYTKHNQK